MQDNEFSHDHQSSAQPGDGLPHQTSDELRQLADNEEQRADKAHELGVDAFKLRNGEHIRSTDLHDSVTGELVDPSTTTEPQAAFINDPERSAPYLYPTAHQAQQEALKEDESGYHDTEVAARKHAEELRATETSESTLQASSNPETQAERQDPLVLLQEEIKKREDLLNAAQEKYAEVNSEMSRIFHEPDPGHNKKRGLLFELRPLTKSIAELTNDLSVLREFGDALEEAGYKATETTEQPSTYPEA